MHMGASGVNIWPQGCRRKGVAWLGLHSGNWSRSGRFLTVALARASWLGRDRIKGPGHGLRIKKDCEAPCLPPPGGPSAHSSAEPHRLGLGKFLDACRLQDSHPCSGFSWGLADRRWEKHLSPASLLWDGSASPITNCSSILARTRESHL